MQYKPEHLKRWTRPECYVGAEWPDHYSAGVGQSRDSDALGRSNFRCMLHALGGESDTAKVIREGRWAVGWVEWIAIHQSDDRALRIADAAKAHLADHPVLDEDDLSLIEDEDAADVWRECYSVTDRIAYIRKHRTQFEFHDFADMLRCVRGQYFAGYASELLS